MRVFLSAAIFMVWTLLQGQASPPVLGKEGQAFTDRSNIKPIALGESFTVHSGVLNEDRTVMVAVPNGYEASTNRYPVFYLVDAQWNFGLTASAIHVLSSNGLIPPMIVVGVNTEENRERDLLPTRDEVRKIGGGADPFFKFLSEELIPLVEKHYRTNPYRVLGGTSYGGVFVMHAFITNPKLFADYLAMSPALGWDGSSMIRGTKEFLSKNPELKCASMDRTIAGEPSSTRALPLASSSQKTGEHSEVSMIVFQWSSLLRSTTAR